MQGTRKIFAAALVVGTTLTALGGLAPAGAHAGHGPPIVTIDRPAAGKVYLNDTEVGGVTGPATSIGDSLTITISWKCPPVSTGVQVDRVIKDSNGNVVSSLSYFSGPAGSWSNTWTTGAAGTYTIETTLTCLHFEQDPRTGKTTKVVDGTDTDSRQLVVIH